MHCEEVFDPVNLFLRLGPSPSWVLLRFQGTGVLELVLELVKWSLKRQPSRDLLGIKMAKLFSGAHANTGLA